jgi:hypothetical protein
VSASDSKQSSSACCAGERLAFTMIDQCSSDWSWRASSSSGVARAATGRCSAQKVQGRKRARVAARTLQAARRVRLAAHQTTAGEAPTPSAAARTEARRTTARVASRRRSAARSVPPEARRLRAESKLDRPVVLPVQLPRARAGRSRALRNARTALSEIASALHVWKARRAHALAPTVPKDKRPARMARSARARNARYRAPDVPSG